MNVCGNKYNPRQVMLLQQALKQPYFSYTVIGHCWAQSVSYQTARSDLLTLAKDGLLTVRKTGRNLNFMLADGWREKINAGFD